MSHFGSWTAPTMTTCGCFKQFDLWVPCAGIVKDSSVVLRRIVLMLTCTWTFPTGSTTQLNRNRDAHAAEYTHENLLHERIVFFRVMTALFGQFSPTGAHRERCCRSQWIASIEKVSASSAHKPYKQQQQQQAFRFVCCFVGDPFLSKP